MFRYRQVPTFGTSTIRWFSGNASGMKKLAARDFEDLLQVCQTRLSIWQDTKFLRKPVLVLDSCL